jgi:hypothetical protein
MIKTCEDVLPRPVLEIQLVSYVRQVRCHVSTLSNKLRKDVSDSDDNVNVSFVKLKKAR